MSSAPPDKTEDKLDEIDEALLSLGCDVLSNTEERLRQICCELSSELRKLRDGKDGAR